MSNTRIIMIEPNTFFLSEYLSLSSEHGRERTVRDPPPSAIFRGFFLKLSFPLCFRSCVWTPCVIWFNLQLTFKEQEHVNAFFRELLGKSQDQQQIGTDKPKTFFQTFHNSFSYRKVFGVKTHWLLILLRSGLFMALTTLMTVNLPDSR